MNYRPLNEEEILDAYQFGHTNDQFNMMVEQCRRANRMAAALAALLPFNPKFDDPRLEHPRAATEGRAALAAYRGETE